MIDDYDDSKNNDDNKGKGGCPGKCGNHGSKGQVGKGVTIMIKDSVTHFASYALNRFMVLCSGKGNNYGNGKNGFSGKGNGNGKDNLSGKGYDNG
jgi:hypothetical protein